MTKAILCTSCSDIFSANLKWRETRDWRWCQCQTTGARWSDGDQGKLEVTSSAGQAGVRVIGLANNFLAVSLSESRLGTDEWRVLHGEVTRTMPPGYLFREDQRNCWAVTCRPGESSDVTFIPITEIWAEDGAGPAVRIGQPGDDQPSKPASAG